MYIHRIIKKTKKKTYKTVLLQRSYRDKKKGPRQETIANLSDWPDKLVENFEKILKGANVFEENDLSEILKTEQGKSYGGIKTTLDLCERLGISKSIKEKRRRFLTLIMISGFINGDSYSKNYIANEWSKLNAIDEVFGKQSYWNEDDLYETLDWLNKNQRSIEKKIFKHKYSNVKNTKTLFLYDVTGSYVEGAKIDLSAFGYQRDGKPGKKQIVIGMMCDNDGDPICIEVFTGNTLDYKTVESQLKKIKNEYGLEKIIFVGDRGMIKSAQIDLITDNSWDYVTAITKPQIEKMLKDNIIQYSLFDEDLCEIMYNKIRYILKKNPFRRDEIKNNFNDKISRFKRMVEQTNVYLKEHKKASVEVAEKKLKQYCKTRKLNKVIDITHNDRVFSYTKNEEAEKEHLKLAGCYVIKTNVSESELSTEQAHNSYKNLSKVEHAFKTIKTTFINIRPLYVRLESHIRGHVFCCMLALKVILYMEKQLKHLKFSLKYCVESLQNIHTIRFLYKNENFHRLPDIFSNDNEIILNALKLNWNKTL